MSRIEEIRQRLAKQCLGDWGDKRRLPQSSPNNANFIVNAPTDIQFLLDEVRKFKHVAKHAADNYVTVIANSQHTPVEEIKADPVVAGWYRAINGASDV